MLSHNKLTFAIALVALGPFFASAATSATSSTAASSTPTIAGLQSLVTHLEAEFAALIAAKGTVNATASEPSSAHVAFTRLLALGAKGADVSALQQILKSAGFYNYPTITGYFGTLTEKALAAYQAAHGLEAVGYTGSKTRALLNGSHSTSTVTTVSTNSTSSTTPPTSTTPPCSASAGFTCVPGTSIVQPAASNYSPGYGGGGGGAVATPPTISGTPSNSTAAANIPFRRDGGVCNTDCDRLLRRD